MGEFRNQLAVSRKDPHVRLAARSSRHGSATQKITEDLLKPWLAVGAHALGQDRAPVNVLLAARVCWPATFSRLPAGV